MSVADIAVPKTAVVVVDIDAGGGGGAVRPLVGAKEGAWARSWAEEDMGMRLWAAEALFMAVMKGLLGGGAVVVIVVVAVPAVGMTVGTAAATC